MNKNNLKQKKIIYVNFSPYENTGKILDFLLDNFGVVALFSFNFHSLGKNQDNSKLKIFKNSVLVKEHSLYQIPVPEKLIFLLLPLRSLIIFIQILFHSYQLKNELGQIDIYFTVNAFTAWAGNILRDFKIVNKTIFWIWDYYPPIHENKIVMLMRWIYWQFDKVSASSDKLVFLNDRIRSLRQDIGVLPKNKTYTIVPIGTTPISSLPKKDTKKVILGFLGVVKISQGLDMIFDNEKQIIQLFPNIQLEVIGHGPDIDYFKSRAKKSKIHTTFHGFLPTQKEVMDKISEWTVGIATYIPEESNVSYYGDPSKIKEYLSAGIPVITTDVFVFSEELKKYKAGIIIDYYKSKTFIQALHRIVAHYDYYHNNSIRLAQKYSYKTLYKKIFDFI